MAVSGTRKDDPLVLLVDDNEDSRDIYQMYLNYKGIRALTARNGNEAIALAREHRPDVVVMDLTMPGMDGWEATRVLKRMPELGGLCIIALTGHAFRGSENTARDAGCDRYIIKPCLPEDLLAAVHDVFAARGAPRRDTA